MLEFATAINTASIALAIGNKLKTLFSFKQENLYKVLWILAVVVLILATALFLLTFPIRWGIGISTAFWAIFFGGTALLFLPPNAITAAFWFMLGAGGSNVISGTGLVSEISNLITNVSEQIISSGGVSEAYQMFTLYMVAMFFCILIILTLPAFVYKKENTAGAI